jgi:hypothetical protein
MAEKITRLTTLYTLCRVYGFFVFIITISLYTFQAFLVALLWCFGNHSTSPKHHNKNYMQPFMENPTADNPTASVGRRKCSAGHLI